MNYSLVYSKLIARARQRVCVDGYIERHHILPKCLGGTDDSSNLVALTGREHFVAHILLAKIHGGVLWHAVTIMKKDNRYNSRLFEMARAQIALRMIGNTNTLGRKATDEERIAMSKNRKGKPGKKHTEETKVKLRQANLGKKLSLETKQKLSDIQIGKSKPLGFGAKISAANLRQSDISKKKRSDAVKSYYSVQRFVKNVSATEISSNIQEVNRDEASAFVEAFSQNVTGLNSCLTK